ncbi:MAG: 3-dehydroquinate synthase [Eggerthellaceae bacterium]|nr:3-dehydroquinate synthase [Eggerthellaceae bacterium]
MPATKIVVNLNDAPSYDVRIGSGILDGIGERVKAGIPVASSALLLTDSNVGPLYAARVQQSLKAAGLSTTLITIPAGETSKTTDCVNEIWAAMAQAKLDRDCVVLGLGGGVVGDIAGFVAASYMRGVHLVQLPTSLLAMVDSSVGGKCGINLSEGKNLVGAFKQPAYVCADTSTLDTLPDREWKSACAEIAKMAILASDDFYFWLEDHAEAVAAREAGLVQDAITKCVVYKADLVATDVFDRHGLRACLNYGHTLGHAIETLAGYGTYSHGEAVAEGMRFAARLGAAVVGTPLELVQAQDAVLDTLGLASLDFSAEPDQLIATLRGDKKASRDGINFVLLKDVGECVLQRVDEETLEEHLSAWARSK